MTHEQNIHSQSRQMDKTTTFLQEIDTVFADLTDVAADMVARFDLEDEAAWALAKGIHRAYRNALQRAQAIPHDLLSDAESSRSDHPAVAELRRLLGSDTNTEGYTR